MQKPPRTWISNATPKQGELVRVRAQIEHTMESGLRTDTVTRSEARRGPTLLLAWEPGISVAPNPYIEFTFLARESGELHLLWKDDAGRTLSPQKTITLG